MPGTVYSTEVLRLASPPEEEPARLRSAAEITAHVAEFASNPFKKSVTIELSDIDPFTKRNITDELLALQALVASGFTIVEFVSYTFSSQPKGEHIRSMLQTICRSPCTGSRFAVYIIGKKNKSLVQVFDGVDVLKIDTCELSGLKSNIDLSHILTRFQHGNRLTSLNLGGIMVSCDILHEWLARPTCSLRDLKLSECGLARGDLIPLILRDNTSLTSLDISFNALFKDQMEYICDSITVNSTLKELNISGSTLSGLEGVVGAALSRSAVHAVNLSSCHCDAGIVVSSMVNGNPAKIWKHINLSNVHINDVTTISCCLGAVESLDLSHSARASSQSTAQWLQFCQNITASSVLREVIMENCGIEGFHMWVLCYCLAASCGTCSDAISSRPIYFGLMKMLFDARPEDENFFIDNYSTFLPLSGLPEFYTKTDGLLTLDSLSDVLAEESVERIRGRVGLGTYVAPCACQRNPGQRSPACMPALEVLKLLNNPGLGCQGAIALSNFIVVILL